MNIRTLQNKLYDLLQVFDSICKENGITYWMHGGSAIGAIRDHDFIPWDDDIDVLIRAEDYRYFQEVVKRELPSHLLLIDPSDFTPHFYDYVIRIVDTRWKLRKETSEDISYNNYQNRVSIDIFLLSRFPSSKLGQKRWLFEYDMLYGMAMNYRHSIDYSKYSLVQKAEIAVLRCMGRMLLGRTPDRVVERWQAFIRSCDMLSTDMRMVSNTTPHCYWQPMPECWFEETVYTDFRDMQVPLPAGYDAELTLTYGDYMVPERDANKYTVHLGSDST